MIYKSLLITSLILTSSFSLGLDNLELKEVVKTSLSNDPWLSGNEYSQKAIEVSSISARTLPDPKISIAAANLATDTFDFNQEAMTQLVVGVSQVFPRGNTLELKSDQLQVKASQFPYQREDRKAQVTLRVAGLWLDAYKAQESIALIEKDRSLFEQLVDIAESSYASTIGKTRQQDIIRAQLELTRLDDKLTILKQNKEMFLHSLFEWLYDFSNEEQLAQNMSKSSNLVLPSALQEMTLINEEALQISDSKILLDYFKKHPSIQIIDKKIKENSMGIDLAKQQYYPQFGVTASYGYRGENPSGGARADLFSAGITFDLPLFTKNKQDQDVEAAVLKTKSIEVEKALRLRTMLSSFETRKSNFFRLNQRESLYTTQLLPQIKEQAEASLTSYTNDNGNFSEVVRSLISQLNAEIDALDIHVEIQKNIINLNYLFMTKAEEILHIKNIERSNK